MNESDAIDRHLLECLAVLAKARGRSIVAELNEAVNAYLAQELPARLGDDGTALLMEDIRSASRP
jgi:hypothetical protein